MPDTPEATARPREKGSISGLAVFILAVGGVLLIPIGSAIHRGDPFGHDGTFYEERAAARKSSTT